MVGLIKQLINSLTIEITVTNNRYFIKSMSVNMPKFPERG